jgi:hypothetical protein
MNSLEQSMDKLKNLSFTPEKKNESPSRSVSAGADSIYESKLFWKSLSSSSNLPVR